ncbi:hypothetical protein CK203_080608 [Vitis vinifera]|uniref:Uncharacterized protein n=1 Tax=Vitis vinifera TaxID=29760 RepID=A0A438EZH2_VITVI|nr:hypothetical protein CK203_080608 [Vitis vinifera]
MEKRFVTCLERKRSSTQASEMEGEPCRRWPEWQESQKQGKKWRCRARGGLPGARRPRRRRTSLERCRKWPEYASRAPTRRRVRCSRRPKIARGRRVAPLLVLVSSQKVEISSRRSFWYGRCRKNRSPESSPESSPENFAGGEWFLATIRLTGKYWEMGKVTGKKHGDRKETRSPEGFPELMTRKNRKELGWAHLKLLETANEGRLAAYPDSDQIGQAKGGVGAAIDRLEGKLNK